MASKKGPFKYVGMARVGTQLKIRVSNNDLFVTQYKSRGETEIAMIELSRPLSRPDAILFMKERVPMFHTPERMALLEASL